MGYNQQIRYLSDIDRRFKLSADQRMLLAHAIADAELKNEQEVQAARRQSAQQVAGELTNYWAAAISNQVDLFHKGVQSMDDMWHGLINKMMNDLIASGLMDLLGLLLPGAGIAPVGGGLFGGLMRGMGVKGFDDPSNDSMMYAAGGKWFSDAMNKFSDGYVSQALTTAQNPPAAMAGGSVSHTTNLSFSFPSVVGMQSPSQQRSAANTVANVIKKMGLGGNLR